MLTGAIHLHSTYSDGEFTLAELREHFAAAGCAFACVTDHAEAFTEESRRRYVDECAALSDARFRLIPGVEFGCDQRMHILGYGVTAPAPSTDPQAVIRHIASEGGIAVIAHPRDAAFEWIESFETLPDGIEVWNSKYDGRYAPRPSTFRLLHRLQRRRPDLLAFFGMDLHWRHQYRGLFVAVRCEGTDDVLPALARGDFVARKGGLELDASGAVSDALLARFAGAHARSARLRELLRGAKRAADRLGAHVPAPIKAQLRRLF